MQRGKAFEKFFLKVPLDAISGPHSAGKPEYVFYQSLLHTLDALVSNWRAPLSEG